MSIKRSDGERERAVHAVSRLRACLDGVDIALRDHDTPIGNEAGNAVVHTAFELGILLAKLDAYQRIELDQHRMILIPTEAELQAGRKVLSHPMVVGTIENSAD